MHPCAAIPPSFEVTPHCTQVLPGETVSLQVSIPEFSPNLTSIVWRKGTKDLSTVDRVTITNTYTTTLDSAVSDAPISGSLSSITAAIKSMLQLSAVRPEDSGTYTVTATNKAGDHNSMTFTLTVKGNSYQAFSLWQLCNSG